MAVDPLQFAKEMSVDTFDAKELTPTNTHQGHIQHSSNIINSKSASHSAHSISDSIEFSDTPFAQSLLPHIHLLGITHDCIQKLSPSQCGRQWTNIGCMHEDLQDASYLLLDHNTKLLRCGGLNKDQFVPTASICDLTQNMEHRNGNEPHQVNWFSLPRLNHRRHGHKTLCINIFNKAHIIAIGGFDSKGNTINKCEMIAVDRIQAHLESSQQNKTNHNGAHRNRKHKNSCYWNMSNTMELKLAIADFGATYDSIHDRIYICGGLDHQFSSLSNCCMFDIKTNKWIDLPNLNVERHCNKTELLYNVQHHNPNILMTFGGWTGNSRNTIEVFDFRNNSNKWQIHENHKKKKSVFGTFNYPHCETASVVKTFAKQNKKEDNLHKQLNGLKIKESKASLENVVIVCGHREGLFVETNFIEALEMRTKKWQTVARFKYAQNCNMNHNLVEAQRNEVPQDNSNINIEAMKQNHRYANAFRYLTLL